ncbi:MAG: TIGR03067 domain-containing protein [Rubrivivax sp.]|nr:TIGR03067 domain-containing protein [Pyrinomonadaceae bacterium]
MASLIVICLGATVASRAFDPRRTESAASSRNEKHTTKLVTVASPAEEARKELQGTWRATKAERDGEAAGDVVGHQLSLTGDRFQLRSKDGKPLYAGTVRVDTSAKPAAIDFEHTEGELKGKAWKGIYALDGDTLTICDNAPDMDKGRPAAFEAASGSGYVLITFKRAKP